MRKIHSHFVIDYYSYRSGLGRWNPLLKIIFTLAALLAVIGTEDIQIAGITFLCMVVLVIKIGKVESISKKILGSRQEGLEPMSYIEVAITWMLMKTI